MSFQFSDIVPDVGTKWLNQSKSDFDQLLPLANRETKFAKFVSEQRAVFKLYSLGVVTARDDWSFDFDKSALTEKVKFFCKIYRDELQRLQAEKPQAASIGDWVNRSIKWTAELETHLVKEHPLRFDQNNVVASLYRPYVAKNCYYAPIMTHRRYQTPRVFLKGSIRANRAICFCVNHKDFCVLASDRLVDYHFTGDTQCLPLYRYESKGRRVSNITRWGLRQFRERYGDDAISAEDVFAYTYGVLHDPVYREKYAIDLLREFPRLPFYPEFRHWVNMGQELLELHIGFESAEPYPLKRVEQAGPAKRVILGADKERGAIVLDDKTSLTGVPPEAWRYRLGNRSALEWVLDQYKERKPRDPTIAEKFNTYRFADYKERVIDLLQRVCTVSVGTMDVVDDMAYWDDEGRLVVYGDRGELEWSMLGLGSMAGHDEEEDPEWLAGWTET